jgi:hypothetical protein
MPGIRAFVAIYPLTCRIPVFIILVIVSNLAASENIKFILSEITSSCMIKKTKTTPKSKLPAKKKAASVKMDNDTAGVDAFLRSSQHPLKAEIEALRVMIKAANKKIAERIKWNAPSFFYKKDMAAFNLHQQKFVQLILIFPYGLITENELLQGDWKDRREARFYDMEDVRSKKVLLQKSVNDWIKLADKNNE